MDLIFTTMDQCAFVRADYLSLVIVTEYQVVNYFEECIIKSPISIRSIFLSSFIIHNAKMEQFCVICFFFMFCWLTSAHTRACEIVFYGKNFSDRCSPGFYMVIVCGKRCSKAQCHHISGCPPGILLNAGNKL